MIQKGKISSFQIALLMHPTVTATGILTIPSATAKYAGRDMWLSPIWAILFGFLAIYIACRLNRLYPSETLIEFSEHIAGRTAGKIIGFVFLLFLLHINGVIIREYADFVVGSFLTETPIVAVITSMIFVCAYAVRKGVEAMGRSGQIMVPVVTLLFIAIVILLLPDLKFKSMMPVMENGILPSMIGAIMPATWYCEYMLISFFLPNVADHKKSMKWSILSLGSVAFILVISDLASLLLLGNITETFTYPVMIAARYISLADFLEHVESVIMAIWVTGVFIKITVFYYALSIGTAQWLKLSDYRPIVFPLGVLLIGFSIWASSSSQELGLYLATTAPFYITGVLLILPLLLLSVALLRKKLTTHGE